MAKYKAHVNAVTIITRGSEQTESGEIKDEFNEFVNKLGDKAKSIQIRKGDETKVGVVLWNHSRIARRDDFVVSIMLDRKGVIGTGRGLVDVQDLAKKYPGLHIDKMGIIKSKLLSYRKAKKRGRGYKSIEDLPTARTRNPLNIAIISYKDLDEVREVFSKFADDAGNGELIINQGNGSIPVSRQLKDIKKIYSDRLERIRNAQKARLQSGAISQTGYNSIMADNEAKLRNIVNQLETEPYLSKDFGCMKGKEVGYVGFSNEEKPLINIVLWHHERAGFDDYWVLIMIRNPIGLATEIDEDSINSIAARTGIPKLEWSKVRMHVLGEKGIRGEIEERAKASGLTNYAIRKSVIQTLIIDEKIDDKKIKKNVKQYLEQIKKSGFYNDKRPFPEVYEKGNLLEIVIENIKADYEKIDQEKELERIEKIVKEDYGITL